MISKKLAPELAKLNTALAQMQWLIEVWIMCILYTNKKIKGALLFVIRMYHVLVLAYV